MRLLVLPRYSTLGASSRLRMFQYVPAFRDAGVEVTISPMLDDGYVRSLYAGRVNVTSVFKGYVRRIFRMLKTQKFDVVWLQKEALPWVPAAIELGFLPDKMPLVVDFDDAVFHRYADHESRLVRSLLGQKYDVVMNRANLITAGNGYLAEHAKKAGSHWVERVPTVVDIDRYSHKLPERKGSAITIGWIGSPSTAGYLRMLDNPVKEVSKRYRIECIAIGARPDQVEGSLFKAIPWSEAEEVKQLADIDIGIMPLPDQPWERGKCGYKLIQYMASGLPVVASPVGINSEIVTPNLNGELAASELEWQFALERLTRDMQLRKRMGDAGRQRVEKWYSMQVQAPRILNMLREVASSVTA